MKWFDNINQNSLGVASKKCKSRKKKKKGGDKLEKRRQLKK
jgi:hypothetical protein